jgi:hypothetical protein
MSTPKSSGASGQKKAGPSKLPSKTITFSNHPTAKNGKQGKVMVNKTKKGGVNLMKKLSGM